MFELLCAEFNSHEIKDFFDFETFKLHNYILLKNDDDDGRVFSSAETASVKYNQIINESELLKLLKHSDDKFTLVGSGFDGLSMSDEAILIESSFYTDTECRIIENVSDEDLIENIPYFKHIIIYNINGVKEFSDKRPEAVLTKLLALKVLLTKPNDTILIIKRDKTIFYL